MSTTKKIGEYEVSDCAFDTKTYKVDEWFSKVEADKKNISRNVIELVLLESRYGKWYFASVHNEYSKEFGLPNKELNSSDINFEFKKEFFNGFLDSETDVGGVIVSHEKYNFNVVWYLLERAYEHIAIYTFFKNALYPSPEDKEKVNLTDYCSYFEQGLNELFLNDKYIALKYLKGRFSHYIKGFTNFDEGRVNPNRFERRRLEMEDKNLAKLFSDIEYEWNHKYV